MIKQTYTLSLEKETFEAIKNLKKAGYVETHGEAVDKMVAYFMKKQGKKVEERLKERDSDDIFK